LFGYFCGYTHGTATVVNEHDSLSCNHDVEATNDENLMTTTVSQSPHMLVIMGNHLRVALKIVQKHNVAVTVSHDPVVAMTSYQDPAFHDPVVAMTLAIEGNWATQSIKDHRCQMCWQMDLREPSQIKVWMVAPR